MASRRTHNARMRRAVLDFLRGGLLIRTWLSCSVQFIDIRSVTSFQLRFSGCDLKRAGRRNRRNSNDRLPPLSFGVIQTDL